MPTRITVRYLGSEVGKKVARPDTKGELLEYERPVLHHRSSSALPTDGRRGRDTATRRDVRATYPNKH